MVPLRLVLATVAVGAAVAAASPGAAPSVPTIELHVSRGGFDPPAVTVRRGETTHVVLTAKDSEHCFAVDELRIEKHVVPGRPTRFDLAADKAGSFAFYCCLETGAAAGKERGRLTVTE
jgi:heme/copper-type cytochrome/quinol oxidase subunit 2